MRAQVLPRFGDADQFELRDVPDPEVAAGEVRVRLRAVGINLLEVKLRNGALQDQMPIRLPAVLGTEFAGQVELVGPGVTAPGIVVGSRVAGFTSSGAYAELVVARADQLALVPAGLSLERAAAVPTAAETSRRVIALLRPRPAETFVVNGAAGSVGSAAVQLLRQAGVRVIGTASAENHDYLVHLGAVPTTYGPGVVERIQALAPQGIDAVFDVAGRDFLDAAIALRGGTDRIVTIADFGAEAKGVTTSWGQLDQITGSSFAPVLDQAAVGQFDVELAEVFAFNDISSAHRLSESSHFRGKIILAGP